MVKVYPKFEEIDTPRLLERISLLQNNVLYILDKIENMSTRINRLEQSHLNLYNYVKNEPTTPSISPSSSSDSLS